MSDDSSHNLDVFPIVRSATTLGLVTLSALCFSAGVLTMLGLDRHARLDAMAALVCGGAGLIGLLPVWLLSRSMAHGAAQGFLIGVLLRMVVAGGVVVAAQWWWKLPDATALSLWIGGWYILVLMIEVKLVSNHVLRRPRPDRQPDSPVVET